MSYPLFFSHYVIFINFLNVPSSSRCTQVFQVIYGRLSHLTWKKQVIRLEFSSKIRFEFLCWAFQLKLFREDKNLKILPVPKNNLLFPKQNFLSTITIFLLLASVIFVAKSHCAFITLLHTIDPSRSYSRKNCKASAKFIFNPYKI